MKIFFVRHGESIFKGVRHQLSETPLSDRGFRQANRVASFLNQIPIDLIISSTLTRSLQTAEAIKRLKKVPFTQNDLFIERKMPSLFLGKLIDDPKISEIHQEIRKHFFEPLWHYAGEENFTDLLTRVNESLEYIITQKKENVVVISHGYFMSVIFFSIVFGKAYPQSFGHFRHHTEISNGGISLCEYKDNMWKLITLNECSHLILSPSTQDASKNSL